MHGKSVLAVFAGLLLFLPIVSIDALAVLEPSLRVSADSTTILVEPNQGYTPGAGKTPTIITLDQIEQCLNTMQCNAKVFTGDVIRFTGVLTDENDRPLPDREVRIIALIPTPELVVLTTATTDLDGSFTAEWVAKLSKQTSAFQDVTRQFQTESLEVFAEFLGDANLAPAKSSRLAMTVTVNTISTMVNSDKTLYREGDTVIIFVAFIDSNDNFIDPDEIRATWNNQPIQLEKKKEGSYTFTIENLQKRHQQVIVVPHKEGLNASTAYLTIIVAGLR
ncbi:MAG: hypothetical protein QXU32_05855 [Nitrososphaerales archaeon]